MKRALVVAALLSSVAIGDAIHMLAWSDQGHPGGHRHDMAFGEPGDPKKPSRTVNITMSEANGRMQFIPNRIEVRQGEQIRFTLRNNGALDHEIVLATLTMNLEHAEAMKKSPEMAHDDPNAKRLAPNKTGEIVWKFTKAGEFDFSCLIPGHREAGMFGTVVVK